MSRPPRRLLQQRPELVRRYVRLTMHLRTMRTARAIARRMVRFKLKWSERDRRRTLDAALQTFSFEAARSRRHGFEALTVVLNLGLFFLIAERDIQAVRIDALTHPDGWTRGLAARVMLLTIHEWEIDKVAGKELWKALDDAKTPVCLKREIVAAIRAIRKAQSRARRQFAYLRNSTIAHRDADAARQYRDIIAIDGLEVANVAGDFYAETAKFIEIVTRLIAHLGTLQGVLGQMAAQNCIQEPTKNR